MNVGYLITGRLKSTRLPKKLLLEIKDKPIISHMIERLKQINSVNDIIICTSTDEQDKPLINIAEKNGIHCYLGEPDDVLVRLLGAAEKYNLDYILNITADCPFVDPVYADKIVEKFYKTDADLIRQFDLPHGVFSYGIKVDALRKVIELKSSKDTEVWGRYFSDTGLFKILDLDVENDFHRRPGLRMTLDYPEDYDFFEKVFNALYVDGEVFTLDQILLFLDNNPHIVEINKECSAKYKIRFLSQSEPGLKKINTVKQALIIGSGSIGQRHIRNLKAIGIDNIAALRSKKGHYKKLPNDLNIQEFDNWDEAIEFAPDIAIISNPTSLHLEASTKIAPYVKGIFVEKPISDSLQGTDRLITLLQNHHTINFVGYNQIFHPIVKKIMQFYDEKILGKIINIQCQVGQWLPDWHPYEDYTKAYYANKKLGGGVALTLIHEIQFALELAGLPQQVFGIVSESKKLSLNVDVCSDLMIKHISGAVSQIHLDYLQEPAHRSGLVTFEHGWISYDFNEMKITGQKIGDDKPQTIWEDPLYEYNLMYLEQIKQFIRYVEEGRMKHRFDIASSTESLKVVEAIFESNKLGKFINIPRNERFTF